MPQRSHENARWDGKDRVQDLFESLTLQIGGDDAYWAARVFRRWLRQLPHCLGRRTTKGRLGKAELVGHQLSRRSGVVRVRNRGERVHLLGQAVTMIKGMLLN